MFLRILMLGVNHRRTALTIMLVITLFTGLGLPKLHIDTFNPRIKS